MRKTLLSFAIVLLCSLGLCLPGFALTAPSVTPIPSQVQLTASVGEFHLDVSGYISPFASVVLSAKDITTKGTVANRNGDFSFTQVLIKRGFSAFCLEAVDFHMLGDSYTCFKVPPATASVIEKDIFLPPTLGLSRTEVAVGQKVYAFGYTMPGAEVQLHVNGNLVLKTRADGTGYYIYELSQLGAGQFDLFATARYNARDSLAPSRVLHLHTMNWWEQLLALLRDFFKKIWSLDNN